jgi:hypothetical protein
MVDGAMFDVVALENIVEVDGVLIVASLSLGRCSEGGRRSFNLW